MMKVQYTTEIKFKHNYIKLRKNMNNRISQSNINIIRCFIHFLAVMLLIKFGVFKTIQVKANWTR